VANSPNAGCKEEAWTFGTRGGKSKVDEMSNACDVDTFKAFETEIEVELPGGMNDVGYMRAYLGMNISGEHLTSLSRAHLFVINARKTEMR